jgi:hypothetical protein
MDKEANEDILTAVIRFLRFFGTEFDSRTTRITSDGVEEKDEGTGDSLEILDPMKDPLKPSITAKYIGGKTFRWADVQAMFRDSYHILYHKCFSHPTPLSRIIKFDSVRAIQERRQELKRIFQARDTASSSSIKES